MVTLVGVTGFEPATSEAQGDTEQGITTPPPGESNTYANTLLQQLVKVWPSLTPDILARIAQMAGLSAPERDGKDG